jgi:HEAT repeat protein
MMTTTIPTIRERLVATLGNLDFYHAEAEVYLNHLTQPEAIGVLTNVLHTGDAYQCVDAIRLLENLQDPGTISTLLSMQKHQHSWARMAAAKALGSFTHWAAASGLLDWMQVEDDVIVLMWIVTSLGRIGDTSAVSQLVTALHQTRSSTLRYTIIRALAALGDANTIPDITRYADDSDLHVQKNVEEALKKLRTQTGQKQTGD